MFMFLERNDLEGFTEVDGEPLFWALNMLLFIKRLENF